MRGVILAITLIIQVTTGQLLYGSEDGDLSFAVNQLIPGGGPVRTQRLTPKHDDHEHDEHHHHHHTHITRLDVTCDERGMHVNLEFDNPFDGVVFSKGHFNNPRCRYVNKDSSRGDFGFIVPTDECGTTGEDRRDYDNCVDCDKRETILVIQNEEAVQEIWDTAKRLQCTKPKKVVKTVSFNPFQVQTLEINEPKLEETTNIECWMNIQVGDTPFGGNVNGKVKIGDQLTAVIYIKDGGSNYDIKVKDCFAHDNSDALAKNVTSLQLSDDRGCPIKRKLLGFFTRTTETGSTGADLIAFAPISAFKFADRSDVYLTCVVELCPGGCQGHCPQGSITNEITIPPPTKATVRTTTQFVCTPGSRDPRCPTPPPPTTPFVCRPGSTDPRCPTAAPRTTTIRTTTQFVCTPGSRDPRCPTPPPPTTQFVCRPGSTDPRCPTAAPRTTTIRTTTQFVCTQGSRDPRCPTPPPPTTQFVCRPGSTDPRCPTAAPRTTTIRTTTQFVCTPGSRDPRCPTPPPPTTQFVCRPGSTDPRCPTPAPRTTTVRTTTRFVCTPGSRDPRCPTPPPPTTQFVCRPGSTDPRCPTPAPRTTTVRTTTRFVCTPGSRDPRCPTPPPPTTQFVCRPGSTDPRCPTPAPRTTTVRTTTQFVCTPGSRDPRCPTPPPPTTQFVCRPGSTDPRCPTPAPRTTAVPRPTPITKSPAGPDKYIRCDNDPTAEGCEDKKYHAFHAWQGNSQALVGRGNRKYGTRPKFFTQRKKRDVSPNNIIITVTSGFNIDNKSV